MPKFLLLILVSLLLIQFISSDPCPLKPVPSENIEDEDDCKDLTVSGEYSACCYLYYTLGQDQPDYQDSCFALKANEVKDYKLAYQRLLETYPNAEGELYCSEDKSAYLFINLLSFLLLILL